jgi:hypothetical protein
VVGSSHIRALGGGRLTGRSAVDRGRTGSTHHLIVDRHGVPLAATLTGGHRNDVTQVLPSLTGSARSVASAVGLASDLTG